MCVSFHAFAILWNNFVITAQNLQIKIFVFFQSFDTRKVRLRWDPMQRAVCECVYVWENVWNVNHLKRSENFYMSMWQLNGKYCKTATHSQKVTVTLCPSVRPTDSLLRPYYFLRLFYDMQSFVYFFSSFFLLFVPFILLLSYYFFILQKSEKCNWKSFSINFIKFHFIKEGFVLESSEGYVYVSISVLLYTCVCKNADGIRIWKCNRKRDIIIFLCVCVCMCECLFDYIEKFTELCNRNEMTFL